MSEKKLYQEKKQAQLDEWRAEIEKFKAMASRTSAEKKLELNNQIKQMEGKFEEGKARLAEIAQSGDEAWNSIKEGMDTSWSSLKDAFRDAKSKFEKNSGKKDKGVSE